MFYIWLCFRERVACVAISRHLSTTFSTFKLILIIVVLTFQHFACGWRNKVGCMRESSVSRLLQNGAMIELLPVSLYFRVICSSAKWNTSCGFYAKFQNCRKLFHKPVLWGHTATAVAGPHLLWLASERETTIRGIHVYLHESCGLCFTEKMDYAVCHLQLTYRQVS